MGVVITFVNPKGGVGKSLTVSATASILTSMGKEVLVINLDPKTDVDMSAGKGVAIKRTDIETPSILHVLLGEKSLKEIIISTSIGDLARASSLLYRWTGSKIMTKEEFSEIPNTPEGQKKLYDRLSQRFSGESQATDDARIIERQLIELRKKYDYILIDTNPSITALTLNGLYAADYVVIPAFHEESSRQAVMELWDIIRYITYFDPSRYLKVAGILMTRVVQRSIASRVFERNYTSLAQQIGTVQFKTPIRQAVTATESITAQIDIMRYDPTGTVAVDYTKFVDELIKRISALEGERYYELLMKTLKWT